MKSRGNPILRSGVYHHLGGTRLPDNRKAVLPQVASSKSPAKKKVLAGATHIVLPDAQIKPGVPTEHLSWIGRYIVDQFRGQPNVTIINLGDFWDLPSLSSYDRGKKKMEGQRLKADIEAGNAAFKLLDAPISRQKSWNPRKVFLLGNHDFRLQRAVEDNAQLEGTVSLDDLDTLDWERHPFLEIVSIEGIAYSHYFVQPMTGKPVAGMIETRLKNIGRSFTQGHQQVLMYGLRPVGQTMHHGLVAGLCTLHDEDYLGPQGNASWRGIIVCHEVRDGHYDPMMVSLDYLCRRYEGMGLAERYPDLGTGKVPA